MKTHLFQLIFVLKLTIKWATANQNSDSETGEVRCYCNLQSCHQTAYMCRSTFGCFLQLSPSDGPVRSGCLELWDSNRLYECLPEFPSDYSDENENGGELTAAEPKLRTYAQLRCCNEDMCNYHPPMLPLPPSERKSIEISAISTDLANPLHDDSDENVVTDVQKISHITALWKESPFWFRLLMIITPIACLLLLGLLLAAAVCTLRAAPQQPVDNRRSFILTNSHRPKLFWTSVFWRQKKDATIVERV